MEVDRVAVADDGSRWLGEYGGVLVDLRSLHGTGLVAALCELLRMLAVVLADAEDVAPREDRGKEPDLVQRKPWPVDRPEPTDFVVSLDEIDHVVHGWIERADARRVDIDGADPMARAFHEACELHCRSNWLTRRATAGGLGARP
jgi:hypothetical protein